MMWSSSSSLVPLLCSYLGIHNTGLEVPVRFCHTPLLLLRSPDLLGMAALCSPSFPRWTPTWSYPLSTGFSSSGKPSLKAILLNLKLWSGTVWIQILAQPSTNLRIFLEHPLAFCSPYRIENIMVSLSMGRGITKRSGHKAFRTSSVSLSETSRKCQCSLSM